MLRAGDPNGARFDAIGAYRSMGMTLMLDRAERLLA